jgi:ribosomal protein S18 acetylase RimI-like enzyme
MNDEDLLAAADANVIAAFQLISPYYEYEGHGSRWFGGVAAVVTGMPSAFYNPVLALDPDTRVEEVRAAVEWIRERGASPSVQVQSTIDQRLRAAIARLGLVNDDSTPVMALVPIPTSIPTAPAELEIRATTPETVDAWQDVQGAGENFRKTFGRAFLANQDTRWVSGSMDGQVVTAALAVRGPKTIGIYAVATIDAARRRGYGQAITWAAIRAGRAAWGVDLAVLQSSDMGHGVYASMGFRDVGRYVQYMPPPPPPPPEG